MRVESLKQRGGKAARGTQAGPGGNVRQRRDLDLWGLEVKQLQSFADNRVMDVLCLVHVFELRILKINSGSKRTHHGYVNVLINRGRDEKSFVLPIIGRKIGASAAQGYSQRTTRDDHIRSSY